MITAIVIISLLVLMVIGVPLAAVMGLAAMACVIMFTHIPAQAVFQQLYQGSEYDLLQAVGRINSTHYMFGGIIQSGEKPVNIYSLYW